MSGWTIATIVLGCLLLFSLIAIIDTGIDAKWKFSNYAAIILFIFLFPIALPFAIWNWIHEANERKKKANQADTIDAATGGYDEGYKNGYSKGYDDGYNEGCIDSEAEQENEE